ncbi:MAG: transketolase C-terminal domain-containing protein [Planctomycetota bacterium]|jgi:transketolase|nr:transketolase C-terminal domain-containing protein [Planctomycetota bacterium]
MTAATVRSFEMGKSTRVAYGETLRELGRERSDIVVLDADLSKSTQTVLFGKEFPERWFNIGIQEANLVSMASGFASCGYVPFISSFAVFLVCKGFDQLRMGVAYPGINVKVVTSHGGISIGQDGPSQMGIEDLGLACSLPGFVVCCPADEVSARELVRETAKHDSAVYLRTGRPAVPIIYGADHPPETFRLGKSVQITDGGDVTLIACGLMVSEALIAHDILAAEGIRARVIDMHTLKPLDGEAVERAARETGAIVTAEEHLLHGGLGSIVAQFAAKHHPVPVESVGVEDTYAESGSPDELLDRYGLRAVNIAEAARRSLARKSS